MATTTAGDLTSSQSSEQPQNRYTTFRLEDLKNQCQNILDLKDYKTIGIKKSIEDLHNHVTNAEAQVERTTDTKAAFSLPLARVQPLVSRIHKFVKRLSDTFKRSERLPECFDPHATWGMIIILVDAVHVCSTHANEILDFIDNMSHELDIVSMYEWMLTMEPDVEELMLEMFLNVVIFLAYSIRYLRRAALATHTKTRGPDTRDEQSSWKSVTQLYEDSMTRNNTKKQQIHQKAQGLVHRNLSRGQILRQLESLQVFETGRSTEDGQGMTAKHSCHTIPASKNPRFFLRTELLQTVRKALDPKTGEMLPRSFTLWGKPGIGKTQLALAYAHECREKGVFGVFWVNAEGSLEILQGFTAIAVELGLEGVKANEAHEQNVLLVMSWLQKTDKTWLLVFDNVEDADHLKNCWPNTGIGCILVTARDSKLALTPADDGIHIPQLSPQEGADFIMRTINRSIYSENDRLAALQLSNLLEGWPLALFQASQNILLTQKRIRTYVDGYESNPRAHRDARVENRYYSYSIETVFGKSFGFLKARSSLLLGVVSFIAPVDIPDDLFETLDTSSLPSCLEFCGNSKSLDDAMVELLSTSLIDKDPDTLSMSIHRLTQELYREFMGSERCYECFRAAAKILLTLFPKHEKGRSLRNRFPECQKFITHALALSERCRDLNIRAKNKGDMEDFCQLAANCTWYLMEIGSWSESSAFFKLAVQLCEDKESLLYADLCNTAGQSECEQGRARAGRPWLECSKAIRERLLPQDDEDLSDSYNNYANVIQVEWKDSAALDEALALYQRALEIDLTKPPDEGSKVLHVRYLNLGTLYTCQNEFGKARENLETGHKYCLLTFGPNSHWDATAEYKLGNVEYFQQNWADARKRFEKARSIFQVVDKLHPAHTAAELKIATIMMKQGEIDGAIDILRKIILICQISEVKKGDQGDTARVMRRLAEALELKGDRAEALSFKAKAEAIRREIQGERFGELPDCERSYDLMVYKAFW